MTGICWILCPLFHCIFYGQIYLTIMYVMDSILEMIYCLFPLLYSRSNGNIFDVTSLGLLYQQNEFVILQSLFATICLIVKCVSFVRDLDPIRSCKTHYRKVPNKNLGTDNLQSLAKIKYY